jgi:hypothetical protein
MGASRWGELVPRVWKARDQGHRFAEICIDVIAGRKPYAEEPDEHPTGFMTAAATPGVFPQPDGDGSTVARRAPP